MLKNPKTAICGGLIAVFYILSSLRVMNFASPKQWSGLLLFAAVAVWRFFRHRRKREDDVDAPREERIEAAERVLGRGRLFWEWLGVAIAAAGVAWEAISIVGEIEMRGYIIATLLVLGGMVYSVIIDVLIDDEVKKGGRQ